MKNRLFWIDLETEGLDPQERGIMEVACIITDLRLAFVKSRSWLVKPLHTEDWLKEHDPFVHSMHTANGLFRDIRNNPHKVQHFTTVGLEIRTWANSFGMGVDKTDPVCGNSVHFDRAFMERYWPGLNAGFSYRNIDVSSEKEEIRRYRPEWNKTLERLEANTIKAHRAMPDLERSIQEFKFYRAKRGDL